MLLPVFDDVLGRTGSSSESAPDLAELLAGDLREFSVRLPSALGSLNPVRVGRLFADTGGEVRESLRSCSPEQALLFLVLVIILLVCAKNLAGFTQVVFVSRIEHSCVRDLRRAMYRKLLDLDLAWFVRARSGEVLSRFTADVDRLRGAATEALVNTMKQSTLLLVYLGIALWASWRLSLVSLTVLPPSVGILVWLGKRLRSTSHLSQQRLADFTAILQETLSGVRVVKAFSMESFERARFHESLDLHRSTETTLHRLRALAPPLTELLGALAAGFLFWYGGRAVLAGDGMTAGRFLLFLGASLSMIDPVKNLSKAHARIQAGLAAGERALEVLDSAPAVVERESPVGVSEVESGVVLDHVWFSYEKGGEPVWVIEDVSLELPRGQMLAIVGPSGAGKSTLADMIPRFHDPVRGRVLLDGVDLRDLELRSLRSLIGFVSQEPVLFNDSVRNNISCGIAAERDLDAEVLRAAEAANALDFISDLPDGLDTVIGERGATLSGGQKQRITIARAIFRDPPILILDEATSSLDKESERLVQQAIHGLVSGRTSLVIAHRLSTVERADRVVVLDQGRIVETGTHGELLKLGGIYRKLYDLQLDASGLGEVDGDRP